MHDLQGKVALITGSTGGIGRGIAEVLSARGARVVINGRDPVKGRAVVEALAAQGREALFVAADVRSATDMKALVEQAVKAFGGLDVVVANAGGDDHEARQPEVRGPFGQIDLQRVTAFVAQALSSKLQVVQAALPALRERGQGSVVLVTSEGGRSPTPGQTAMASFAGGLIMASKVLSKELARENIRVNAVCVTVVRDTPSWVAAFESPDGVSAAHRRQYEKIIERSPLGVARPDDIGRVVAFLASDDSGHLTGTVLSPTGGLTLH